MGYCSHCGSRLAADSRFCECCGHPQNPAPTVQVTKKVSVSGGRKWWKGLIVWVLLVAGAATGIYASGIWKSDETLILERITDFEEDYNQGDYEAVLEHFEKTIRGAYGALNDSLKLSSSFKLFDKGDTKLGLSLTISDLFSMGTAFAMGDGLHFEVESVKISGSKAYARTILHDRTNADEKTFEITVTLVKEGTKWYISDISD